MYSANDCALAMIAQQPHISITPHHPRSQRKTLHWVSAFIGTVLMCTGVFFSIPAHALKLPVPYPQLFSVHSYCGTVATALMMLQFILGFAAFLFPKFKLHSRKVVAKIHVPLGMLTYLCAAGAIITGLQEKATFVRVLDHAYQYSAAMVIPAVLAVLVIVSVGLVQFVLHGTIEEISLLKPESFD